MNYEYRLVAFYLGEKLFAHFALTAIGSYGLLRIAGGSSRTRLPAQLLGRLSLGSLAYLSSGLSHSAESRIWREFGDGLGKIFVKRIASLLLNFPSFGRLLVAMTSVKARFSHVLLRSVGGNTSYYTLDVPEVKRDTPSLGGCT